MVFKDHLAYRAAEPCSLPKASAKVEQFFVIPNFLRRKIQTFFTLFYNSVILSKLHKNFFLPFSALYPPHFQTPPKGVFSNGCGMAK